MGRPQPGRGSSHAFAAPQLLSLMAPVLGPLRAVMPQLPRLQQVLLMCPQTEPGSTGSTFAFGIAKSLVGSCLDR